MRSGPVPPTNKNYMQKRIYIIHGWGGYPEEGWFPWLKKELENHGFLVIIAKLPQSDEPRINIWVPALKEIVGVPNEQTYFVGHSMGCQNIARYIETLPENIKVGGAVFVAGFFKELSGIEDDEVEHSVVNEWMNTPLDLQKVKSHLNKSIAIFSDNDPFVPFSNQEEFKNILGSKIILEHNKGHFSGENGIIELPSVLSSVLEISQ